MPDTVEKDESWRWLRTGDLKIETETIYKNGSNGNGKDFKKSARVLATRRSS